MNRDSLQILERALLVHRIRSADANGLPLNIRTSGKVMKPLFLNVSLMQYHSGIHPSEIQGAKDLAGLYRGVVAEQVVGQELFAAGGSDNYQPFYWLREQKSNAVKA